MRKIMSAILFAAFTVSVFGQTDIARIAGTVTDASGAVIPGANITVTSEGTGQVRKATSNEHGMYIATQLVPAIYTVKVESAGMAPAEFTGVRVQVGQERTLNVVLEPSTVTTEVNVSSGGLVVIDTCSASTGTTVGERAVAN